MKFETNRIALEMAMEKIIPIYGANEADALLRVVFEHYFKLDRAGLALQGDEVFSSVNQHKLDEVVQKLKNGIPVQYITNVAHFHGLEFFVDERVLIPRPETEELVQWIIDDNSAFKDLTVLDIGTGSGCIAVALAAKIKQATVEGCDVSEKALEVAGLNAQKNGVEVGFFELDILTEELPKDHYDVIVSNPPYVMEREKAFMHANVLDHEPHKALFVPDNEPLLFCESIGKNAFESLKNGGCLYLEINENLAKETISLLENIGFGIIELRKDLRGKDRMVRAQKVKG